MTRVWLAVVVAIGLAIRIAGPWSNVFTPTHVNLLDSDAWYHLRVVDNLVQQFPHRLTVDPYAAPDGQYVAVAPLFDQLVAAVVWMGSAGSPTPEVTARIAAFVPPILGAVTILLVFAIARLRAGPVGGLLAAALAAILPGHFLDRTLVGFVDHHALEALLAMAVLYLLARALEEDGASCVRRTAFLLGVVLAAYLLTWTSAAFLIAVITAWLALHALVCFWRGVDAGPFGRMLAVAGGVAAAIVRLLQDPGLGRYELQFASLAVLVVVAVAIDAARAGIARRIVRGRTVVMLAAGAGVVMVAAVAVALPTLTQAITTELLRFTPSPDRMQVLEARPLFLFDGAWSLRSPWLLFRSGFFVGLGALAVLVVLYVRQHRPIDLLLLVWGAAMFLATIGQNRFGYYLVPIVAVLGGCLSLWVIDAGRRQGGRRRDLAVIGVAALLFGPNLVPAIWTTGRPAGLPAEWLPAFEWLREQTPEPFGDPGYYYARYPATPPKAAETVMVWWDYGYWVMRLGHRVPTANPTQNGAPEAAAFFLERSDARASHRLAARRARFVLVDDQLPLRVDGQVVVGKFEGLTTWAKVAPSEFYDLFLVPQGAGFTVVPLYYPAYFESMAFRLAVLGGAARPSSGASVVSWEPRVLPGVEGPQKVVTALRDFATTADAQAYLASRGAGEHRLVGRHPRQPPIDLPAVTTLRRVYRTPAPGTFGEGVVQVFEATGQPPL